LDYFLVDKLLSDRVNDSAILDQIMGSDHCPISLEIQL
jgi:exodeoxyribonuclease-3